MAKMMIAAMRLSLTASRDALVASDDPRAAFLYAAVGDEIPGDVVEKFGLVDGKLPAIDAAAADAARKAEEEAAAAEAQRLADEAAAAEAKRKADEEAAAAEAQRLADEAAAEAQRLADEAAAAEAAKKAAEDATSKEPAGGTTKEAKPGKAKA